MAYWHMTEKMAGHEALEPGKTPIAAVYGLGKGVLQVADGVSVGSRGRNPNLQNLQVPGQRGHATEHAAATQGRDLQGFASTLRGSGVLVLTDRRLLFFNKRFAIGRPKKLSAQIPVGEVVGATDDKPMLSVSFADGSVVGLHVPTSQKPDEFVAAVGRG